MLVRLPSPEAPLKMYLSIYCAIGRRPVSALVTAVAIVSSKIITPYTVSGGTSDVCIDALLATPSTCTKDSGVDTAPRLTTTVSAAAASGSLSASAACVGSGSSSSELLCKRQFVKDASCVSIRGRCHYWLFCIHKRCWGRSGGKLNCIKIITSKTVFDLILCDYWGRYCTLSGTTPLPRRPLDLLLPCCLCWIWLL